MTRGVEITLGYPTLLPISAMEPVSRGGANDTVNISPLFWGFEFFNYIL